VEEEEDEVSVHEVEEGEGVLVQEEEIEEEDEVLVHEVEVEEEGVSVQEEGVHRVQSRSVNEWRSLDICLR